MLNTINGVIPYRIFSVTHNSKFTLIVCVFVNVFGTGTREVGPSSPTLDTFNVWQRLEFSPLFEVDYVHVPHTWDLRVIRCTC